MGYDEKLADEVRALLEDCPDLSERKMFGGVAFLLSGHMAAGVAGPSAMLRLGEEAAQEALAHPNVRPMDFTGRPMRGYVFADRPDGAGVGLDVLVQQAVSFVRSLPPK
jgi:TfoX N-terminal domain